MDTLQCSRGDLAAVTTKKCVSLLLSMRLQCSRGDLAAVTTIYDDIALTNPRLQCSRGDLAAVTVQAPANKAAAL